MVEIDMPYKICFCDIDHTISDAWWRDHLLGDWEEYHRLGRDDRPIPEAIALLESLYMDSWRIIGLTARPEKWRQQTMNWCLHYQVMIDELIMRPENNFQGAAEFKLEEVRKYCAKIGDDRLIILLDDRDDVIASIKANIKCIALQVNKGGVGG
jgi:phosphoglycolate phosphatase-like HAD superfamily hydrolase